MLILIDLWKTDVLFTRKERRAGYCSSINGRSSLTCRPRKKKPTRRERHRQRQTDQRRSKLKIEIVPKPVFVEYLFPSWAGTPPPPHRLVGGPSLGPVVDADGLQFCQRYRCYFPYFVALVDRCVRRLLLTGNGGQEPNKNRRRSQKVRPARNR